MTAEILLILLLTAATGLSAGLGALILGAFGQAGWFVILGLLAAGALSCRIASAHLAARSDWLREDLRDDWRAG